MKSKIPPIWFYRKAIDDYLTELEKYCRRCVPIYQDRRDHPQARKTEPTRHQEAPFPLLRN